MNKKEKEGILIVDFGSQYVQLIARRIRENKVLSVVSSPSITISEIKKMNPSGIIFSGGPSSVYDKGAPKFDPKIFELGLPIMGICYGMQIIGKIMGGTIKKSGNREYGRTIVKFSRSNKLFKGIESKSVVWMSHRDKVIKLPKGFSIIGESENTKCAGFMNKDKEIYGVQFHPEVVHTDDGNKF